MMTTLLSMVQATALGHSLNAPISEIRGDTRFATCVLGFRDGKRDKTAPHRLVFQFDTNARANGLEKVVVVRDDDAVFSNPFRNARRIAAKPYDGFAFDVSLANGRMRQFALVPRPLSEVKIVDDGEMKVFMAVFYDPSLKSRSDHQGGCVVQGGPNGQLNAKSMADESVASEKLK